MATLEQVSRRRRAAGRLVLFASALLSASLLYLPAAAAKPAVVMLTFGGRGGATARATLIRSIRGRYRIIPGSKLLAACDELGVKFGKGRNLAKAARHVGAVAVVGGKVVGNRLTYAVFSGTTGRPLVSKAVRWGRRPPKASVRSVRAVLLQLLAKEARRARGRGGRSSGGSDMTFKPEPVSQSGGGRKPPPKPVKAPKLSFDPDPVSKSGGDSAPAAGGDSGDEQPPDLSFKPGGGDGASGSGALDLNFKPDGAVKKKPADEDTPAQPSDGRPPRVEAELGLGIWSRVFSLNQPAEGQDHAEYKSGAAFALQLALRGHPGAFFTDGFARDIFLRLRFKVALGLSSRTDPTAADGLSTSMSEVIFDGGYHWNVLGKPDSPVVELGLGGGATSFSIDWGTQQAEIAAVSYSYLLLALGAGYPFMRALGDAKPGDLFESLTADLRFDYRILFGAGQVAEDNWYGSSSQGGLELSLGLTWRYKAFVSRLAYTYTRYFLSFDGAAYATRVAARQLAAGGALDQFHGINVSGGYSF